MDALLKAPPVNRSRRPARPWFAPPPVDEFNTSRSTPGKTTKDPILKIRMNPSVTKILDLRSSMLQIFFNVCMKFFILSYKFLFFFLLCFVLSFCLLCSHWILSRDQFYFSASSFYCRSSGRRKCMSQNINLAF